MKMSELGDVFEEHTICAQNAQRAKKRKNTGVRRRRGENNKVWNTSDRSPPGE